MTTMRNMTCHIYGLTLGGAMKKLYVGCAHHDADFDKAKALSELKFAGGAFNEGMLARIRNGEAGVQDLDLFEIESHASELEAEEALEFWRNYFRALGFELYVDL
jgi:hypothetical protein